MKAKGSEKRITDITAICQTGKPAIWSRNDILGYKIGRRISNQKEKYFGKNCFQSAGLSISMGCG